VSGNCKAQVLVYGAGGRGKVVADVVRSAGFEVAGFLDDAPAREGKEIWGLPDISVERLSLRPELAAVAVALGIGDNGTRALFHQCLRDCRVAVATVVHKVAVLAPTASVGLGTGIMANAVVNPDARVGAGCIINTGVVVEHDCTLGDYVHLSPNVALGGAVTEGTRTHVGLGALVLPSVKIGSNAQIGAGAAVIRDVADNSTAVGVPARSPGSAGTVK
jgi:sugar O-acyltransferase (sialic acid O-acetyltransferase NeuD family)